MKVITINLTSTEKQVQANKPLRTLYTVKHNGKITPWTSYDNAIKTAERLRVYTIYAKQFIDVAKLKEMEC